MPRFAFNDLFVPSFDVSGSPESRAYDPPPPSPNLTINYTCIDFARQPDEFDFKSPNGEQVSDRDRWIDVISWDHGRETTQSTSNTADVKQETEISVLELTLWELDTFL